MSRIRRSAARIVPILAASFIAIPGLFAATSALAEDVGMVNFTLGYKRMSTDWELGTPGVSASGDTLAPASASQPGLGVELTWGRKGWPASLAIDVLHSYDDGMQHFPFINLGPDTVFAADARRRASTLEIGVGLRRSFGLKAWEPYIGAGGSWVHANVIHEVTDPAQGSYGALISRETGHDSSFGYWVGGGLLKRFGQRFHLGLTGRYSSAKVDLPSSRVVGESPHYHFTSATSRVDAGGRHIGLVLGWDFPGR